MGEKIIRVFISYAWDEKDFDPDKEKVLYLAAKLRNLGCDVHVDITEIQENPSLNFPKMMASNLKEADKVLIILTEKYKNKADSYQGGVGTEYEYIIGDILENEKKYILCTFEFPITDEVVKKISPDFLKNRNILSILKISELEKSDLIYAIYGMNKYVLPDMAEKPFIPEQVIIDPKHSNTTSDISKTTQLLEEAKDVEEDDIENDIDSYSKSTLFFAYRFRKAFPGIRGERVFDNPKEAADRLEVLLRLPLSSSKLSSPIWWFRGYRNLPISYFSRISDDKFLMDSDEIRLKRIIAYAALSCFREFVYVEAAPETPTGLYDAPTPDELNEYINNNQICTEEYAVVGDKLITRAEYDDGGMVIDGKPIDVSGKAELRVRYLTPYNFLICAQFNPINNSNYDIKIKDIMDSLLKKEVDFSVLSNLVEKMPKYRDDI